jgi:hypothetical protein
MVPRRKEKPSMSGTDTEEVRYNVRVIMNIRADLAHLLAERAIDERRTPREQAAWLLEQKLIEDRNRVLSPTG